MNSRVEAMVAARSDAMSIVTIVKATKVMRTNRATMAEAGSKKAMMTNKVAMEGAANKGVTTISKAVAMEVATVREASKEVSMIDSRADMVAARSDAMSIGTVVKVRKVIITSKVATVGEASKEAMTTSKVVAMEGEASKEATMISSRVDMVAARSDAMSIGIIVKVRKVMTIKRAATVEASRAHMAVGTFHKEEAMAVEEDMV